MSNVRQRPPAFWRSEWGWYTGGNWRRDLEGGLDRLTIAGVPDEEQDISMISMAVARRGSIAMESNFDEDRN